MKKKNPWQYADDFSDYIVEEVRREIAANADKPDWSPLQLLGGQLLALKALQRTMPESSAPRSFKALFLVVDDVLNELLKVIGRPE